MDAPKCHKAVRQRNGQCLASSRNCALPVVYTDALGKHWCKRHEPDAETKEIRAGIARAMQARGLA